MRTEMEFHILSHDLAPAGVANNYAVLLVHEDRTSILIEQELERCQRLSPGSFDDFEGVWGGEIGMQGSLEEVPHHATEVHVPPWYVAQERRALVGLLP